MFLMMIVNSLIYDDHTNVFVNDIRDEHLQYAGFLVSVVKDKFIVSHSTDSRIPLNSVITKVNGKGVELYIRQFNDLISPTTENSSVNARRAAAYMGVMNPFLPVKSIMLESGREVQLKYVRAKRGLFSRDLRKSMQ